MLKTTTAHRAAPTERPASAGPSTTEAAQAQVLLVDDQPGRLLAYEAMLQGLGVGCVKATSGAKALERVLEQPFALILLDVHMPEMDGFEVARLVRQHPRYGGTPIIFVTAAHSGELDLLKGYELGAIDYLSMPMAPEVLRSKVAVLVAMQQKRHELEALNRSLEAARRQVVAAQERRDRALIEDAPVGVAHVALAGEFVYANKSFCALVGYEAHELLTRTWQGTTHPDDLQAEIEVSQRVLDGALPHYTLDKRFLHKSGREVWVHLYGNFVHDDDGRPVQRVLIANDITPTRVESSERRQLQSALEAAERRKDEFLAMLAHELRNPVAPIRTAAEVLAMLLNGDARKRALVDIIQRQSSTLSRILDDLLDVARITQGRIELQREVVSVAACVETALQSTGPLMREKAHRIDVRPAREALHVSADRVRLEQCVTNLLINAAKFTPPRGEIHLQMRAEGDEAVIEVRDNGVGIAPAFLPRVFDLFSQSERSMDRSQGGLGLGLAICRQLIELHGGSVGCSSPGEAQGTTVTIRLPRVRDPLHTAAPAARAQQRRVLVVDDNHDAADTLTLWLDVHGHTTRTVYGAEAALEAVAGFAPDVVLLDLGLPGMDGFEVARRIKRQHPSMRLVALSGYGQARDRERSAAAGFDAHAVKPVDMDELDRLLAG
ncbi:MAG TPA: response regulator [Burkholderiaceae bacterium]|nr:response regulator [Burkholderiaceae bacterium]